MVMNEGFSPTNMPQNAADLGLEPVLLRGYHAVLGRPLQSTSGGMGKVGWKADAGETVGKTKTTGNHRKTLGKP